MDIIGDAGEQGPAEPEPGTGSRRTFVQPEDLFHALADGLIALGSAIAVAALSLVILIYSAGGQVHGGLVDFLVVAVWLTGASLGVPVRETVSTGIPGGSVTATAELRAVAWLLTGIVLFLVFRLVRRRERGRPSAAPTQRVARALLTALVIALVLLVLALVTNRASVFGLFTGAPDPQARSSIGLEPGFVFAGPLLLTAAAALVGAFPWRLRASPWGLAWGQFAVTGVIAGVTLLVYAAAEVGAHGNSRETMVTVIGLVLLLPNLAIYGTLGGFCTTFYATLSAGSLGQRAIPANTSHSIGIFGSIRPWILWLLLGAAAAGVLVPALLARRAQRAGRAYGSDYQLAGIWRPAVAGLASACAVIPLGSLSYTSSTSGIQGASLNIDASAGTNLFAAAGLTAAWLCLGYLATSMALHATEVGPT